MDDTLLLDCFVGGLHPELKRELKSYSPHSLLQAVSLAKLFEEKFFLLHLPTRSRSYLLFPKPLNQILAKPLPAISSPASTITPLLPKLPKATTLRKLSLVEIQFRCDKGICFTCNDKYLATYCYTTKHYYLIQTNEEISLDTPKIYNQNQLLNL